MQFALSMTMVVLVSSTVLLYQFWSGALTAGDDGEQPHRR